MLPYDTSRINSRTKKLTVEMENQLFNTSDPIPVLNFSQTF